MSLRLTIVIMSAFGVISDAILIAFYPQFFEVRYGITSPVHVGAYIAAISIAVMCTLPLWARVARHVETMHLLVYTQLVAGTFGALSAWADTVTGFWVLTMLMFMTKSSYLLMFPYLMRLEKAETHAATIGLLSVVVHIGGIFGAMAGGLALQQFGPRTCLWMMAAGDFVQMGLCLYLIRTGRVVKVLGTAQDTQPSAASPAARRGTLGLILRLSLLMLLFDFSAYLVRPFFSVYWEDISGMRNQMLTGLVFAIPGVVAIVALLINKRATREGRRLLDHTLGNLLLGAAGLLLQASQSVPLVLIGRCLYGWSLFQVIVKLEVTLFKVSTPDAYAKDFSIANFFQNLGVLLSSFGAGVIVSRFGMEVTFVLAAVGLLLTAVLDRWSFGVDRRHAQPAAPADATSAADTTLAGAPHAS
ncbi:Predicted arabinose efflux permease, MFS family [Cupriavidus sp. YR651]|uniref:MFS transporter n=1 Tax=Cupriavidus sp. YR651 TaxID=1855315 RepID=UPI00088D494A|nr:MFS transporter [Cupriavidus sp. YR651]SDC81719.1 Predicted arabinose efflux permease, MFS family [Cupriavidus sp. YR651]